MHNPHLERELEAHARHGSGPLTWWRTLPAQQFAESADVVEAAVASIAAVSRLAPADMVSALATTPEEERVAIWNDLALHFLVQDRMQHGLCAHVGASAAALSANLMDAFGLVTLLNLLSQPFLSTAPHERLATATSWLAARGALLNRANLAGIDWFPEFRSEDGRLGYLGWSEDGE